MFTDAEGFRFLGHFLDKALQGFHIYQANAPIFTTGRSENAKPQVESAKEDKGSDWLSPCVLYVFY